MRKLLLLFLLVSNNNVYAKSLNLGQMIGSLLGGETASSTSNNNDRGNSPFLPTGNNSLTNPTIDQGAVQIFNRGQLVLLGYATVLDKNPSIMTPDNILNSYTPLGYNAPTDAIYSKYLQTRDSFIRKDLTQQLYNALIPMLTNYRGKTAYIEYSSGGTVLKDYDFNNKSFEIFWLPVQLEQNTIPFRKHNDIIGRDFKSVIRAVNTTKTISSPLKVEVPDESVARKIEASRRKDNLGMLTGTVYSIGYHNNFVTNTAVRSDVLLYDMYTREKFAKKTFLLY